MAEPNPDTWAQAHMRWLALSRWDNEGGASSSRPTAGSAGSASAASAASAAGSAGPALRHDRQPWLDTAEMTGPVLLLGTARRHALDHRNP